MITDFLKDEKSLVLFDMDGVLAEYKWGENDLIKGGDTDVYLNKRPIYSAIEVAKSLYDEGIGVGILSSCETLLQKEAKLKWLSKYVPFIKENIYILVWSELGLVGKIRDSQKARVMQGITEYKKVFLIDDKHKVINATNEILPNTAHHVSEILR